MPCKQNNLAIRHLGQSVLVLLCNTVTYWMPGTIYRKNRQEAPKRCLQGWNGQIFSAGRVEQGETPLSLPWATLLGHGWGESPMRDEREKNPWFPFLGNKGQRSWRPWLRHCCSSRSNVAMESHQFWRVVAISFFLSRVRMRERQTYPPHPFKHLPSLNKSSEKAK